MFVTRREYEQKALLYAEKHGIIDYKVATDKMYYKEVYSNEGMYQCTVDLNAMKEYRTHKEVK